MYSRIPRPTDPRHIAALILFAILALSEFTARADSAASAAASAALPKRSDETRRDATPILWQVDLLPRDAEAKPARLYLLGSIHVGPSEGWRLPPELMEILDRADALVVEVDMEAPDAEAQDDAVMRYGLLPGGESLKNHVSAETYASLGEHLKKTNRSLANVNPWRAWMVATMLLSREIERLGYPAEGGVDIALMNRARNDKRILALESAQEQLKMLGDMSDATQELMLKDTLLQMPKIDAYFDELKNAWRRGDEQGLASILFAELEEDPTLRPFYQRVIFDRNQIMGTRLRELARNGGNYFVVVGAAHLVGSRGIPAQFLNHGARVTRLRLNQPSR